MRFQNVSSRGDLEFPLVGKIVKAGEIIELNKTQSKLIEGQDNVWAPVTEENN